MRELSTVELSAVSGGLRSSNNPFSNTNDTFWSTPGPSTPGTSGLFSANDEGPTTTPADTSGSTNQNGVVADLKATADAVMDKTPEEAKLLLAIGVGVGFGAIGGPIGAVAGGAAGAVGYFTSN